MPPTYDFECQACGFEDEESLSSTEVSKIIRCPECSETRYMRIWKKMPGLTKASFISSKTTKRARDMDIHRKIANLEILEGNTPHKNRPEIVKEINILKKI